MMMMMTANQDFTMKKKILLNKMLGRKTCFFRHLFLSLSLETEIKNIQKECDIRRKKTKKDFNLFAAFSFLLIIIIIVRRIRRIHGQQPQEEKFAKKKILRFFFIIIKFHHQPPPLSLFFSKKKTGQMIMMMMIKRLKSHKPSSSSLNDYCFGVKFEKRI